MTSGAPARVPSPVALAPLLALVVCVPLLGSTTDPFGGDALRLLAVQAVLLVAAVGPLLRGAARGPAVFALGVGVIAVLGLRDVATAIDAAPLVLAATLAAVAPILATRPRMLPWALVAGGVAVAGWGLVDTVGGGAGVVALGNANRVGEFVATVIPAAAALVFTAVPGRRAATVATGAGALALLFAWTLVTASRGGLLVGAIELVLVGLLARAPRRLVALVALGALVVAALWVVPTTRHRLTFAFERARAGTSAEYPSNAVRLGVMAGSARAMADHPLGVGHGRFEDRFMRYREPSEHRLSGWRSRVPDAHNQVLHSGVETGWLGALAMLALFWLPAFGASRRAWRAEDPASGDLARAAAVTAIGLGLYSWIGTPLLNHAALVNAALVLGAATGIPSVLGRGPSARIAVAVLAVVTAFATVPEWLAQRDRIRARDLVARQDPAARDAWHDAANHTPHSSATWLRVAVFALAAQDRTTTDRAIENATTSAPDDVTIALFSAAVALDRGDAGEALAIATRARDVQPHNPLPHVVRARALRALRREDDAIDADRAAVDADRAARSGAAPAPPMPLIRAAARRVGAALGRRALAVSVERGPADALDVYREALDYDPGHGEANLALAKHHADRGDTDAAKRYRYRGLLRRGIDMATLAQRLRRDEVWNKAIKSLTLASLERPEAIDPHVYLAATRTLHGVDDAPWHDAARARDDLATARRLGLRSLDAIELEPAFRAAVEPLWRTTGEDDDR